MAGGLEVLGRVPTGRGTEAGGREGGEAGAAKPEKGARRKEVFSGAGGGMLDVEPYVREGIVSEVCGGMMVSGWEDVVVVVVVVV